MASDRPPRGGCGSHRRGTSFSENADAMHADLDLDAPNTVLVPWPCACCRRPDACRDVRRRGHEHAGVESLAGNRNEPGARWTSHARRPARRGPVKSRATSHDRPRDPVSAGYASVRSRSPSANWSARAATPAGHEPDRRSTRCSLGVAGRGLDFRHGNGRILQLDIGHRLALLDQPARETQVARSVAPTAA